jgi:hypothetical protein
MFSKNSRYWKLPDVITTDKYGGTHESRSLRLPIKVSGAFSHTVTEVDRIDHLAQKYYKQPRKWWRICDANPEFMAPQALLGKGPIKTVRFFLGFNGDGDNPPWHDLIDSLLNMPGVENAMPMENINLLFEDVFQINDGSLMDIQADGVPADVVIELESMKDEIYIGQEEFVSALEANIEIDRIDEFVEKIVNHSHLTICGESIIIYPQIFEHSVLVEYNQMNTDFEALSNVILEAGFVIEGSEIKGQIGKKISIPANSEG